jgi:hypothetical protein
MKKAVLALLLLVPLLLAACQPATPAAVPPAPSPSITAGETVPAPISGTPPASSEAMVKMSIEMLHQKFNIPTEAVSVTEVTPMTWPDASLGCPKRGVLYIQTITPGFQILLEAEGHVFTFHTDEKSLAVLCSVEPPDEIYLQP